jgi:hypothetical protein
LPLSVKAEKVPPDDEVIMRLAPETKSVPLVTRIIRRTSPPGVVVPGLAATETVNGGYGLTTMFVLATALR